MYKQRTEIGFEGWIWKIGEGPFRPFPVLRFYRRSFTFAWLTGIVRFALVTKDTAEKVEE